MKPATTPTRWGKPITLAPFASVGETERALVGAGVLGRGTWPDGARFYYAKDNHFADYTLAAIQTEADAEAFLKAVDLAAKRRSHGGGCAKVREARAWMSRGFCDWKDDPAWRWRSALSSTRRTCCGCHETGSYATYARGHKERRQPHEF
jgi:hypothetical protein